jgi:hypothetical protein
MRVLNDKGETKESPEIGPFTVVTYALFCALGVSTLLLGPLPILYAHSKMTQPWPKIAALAGAVLALLALDVPLVAVLISFVLGLHLSDAVTRRVPIAQAFGGTLSLAMVLGLAGIAGGAYLQRESLLSFWMSGSDLFVTSLQSQLDSAFPEFSSAFDWTSIRSLVLYEGPFLYLSAVLVSLWVSVGLAAHLNWWPKNHPYSATNLQKISIPAGLTFLFLLFFVGTVVVPGPEGLLFRGFYRLMSCLFFVQGTVAFSRWMEIRGLRVGTRAIIYTLSILFGFYLLVGMGVVAPWAFRNIEKKQGRRAKLGTRTLEEAI